MFQYYFAVIATWILFSQCEDVNSNPIETPIFNLLFENNIAIDTVTQAAITWKNGFKFKSLLKGKLYQHSFY